MISFFFSLKRRVWAERYVTFCELVWGVASVFHTYDVDTLERVCQSLFKIYSQVLRPLGGNDFEVGHIVTKKRQQEGELARVSRSRPSSFRAGPRLVG